MDLSSVFSLAGKVALVTGASKGIEIFAAAGAKVVLCSRKQDAVDEMAKKLRCQGYEAVGIACNVGNLEDLPNLVEKTIAQYGQLDVLVNNAASNPVFGPIHETSLEAFDKIMNVNTLFSSLTKIKWRFDHQHQFHWWDFTRTWTWYLQCKQSCLISLSKVLAKEWGDSKIRVNTICPGLIQTKFSEALWSNDKIMATLMKQLAIKRAGTSEEIGAMALFLASGASSYTTGAVFTADGGYTI
ncbi:carbonyl reductase [Daphnia sinensis]|uniref:Carbonyl reductase n=1 Tax=Daphnia sinensis TaxID=1820382 RepID=A0AAD5PKJ6_9CRUS|nr:carbonyl reductase [Daphnia sinensis]